MYVFNVKLEVEDNVVDCPVQMVSFIYVAPGTDRTKRVFGLSVLLNEPELFPLKELVEVKLHPN